MAFPDQCSAFFLIPVRFHDYTSIVFNKLLQPSDQNCQLYFYIFGRKINVYFPHFVPVPVILQIRYFFSTELEGKYTEHYLCSLHQTLQRSGLPVELAKTITVFSMAGKELWDQHNLLEWDAANQKFFFKDNLFILASFPSFKGRFLYFFPSNVSKTNESVPSKPEQAHAL